MKKIHALIGALLTIANGLCAQTITLQPSAADGYEGVVSSPYPTQVSSDDNIVAAYWTGDGTPGAWRTFFKFDLTQLPSNVVVDSAFLSLYADLGSTFGIAGSPTTGTDNSGQVCRVTGPWDKNTMNWNNKPSYTTLNAITLPQSTSSAQDYVDMNVTSLVTDMMTSGNNGFMIKMVNEANYYNSLIFHSSKAVLPVKRPKLYIKYHLKPTSVGDVVNDNIGVEVFPNPCNDFLNISVLKQSPSAIDIAVYDQTGKLVAQRSFAYGTSMEKWRLDTKGFAKGIYTINVLSTEMHEAKTFVVN